MIRAITRLLLFGAAIIANASSLSFPSRTAALINDFYMNQNRFKVAFLTCSTKACAADLVAQWIDRTAEKRRIANNNEGGGNTKNTQQASPDKKLSIDFRRAAVFLLYGGLYQGMAQEYIYNDIYATLFGSGTDILTASKKVSAEMFVLTPLLCIPAAYLIKGLLGGNTIRGALKKYRDDVIHRKILFINWSKCFGRHDKSALTCAIDIYKLLSVLLSLQRHLDPCQLSSV
jgi:hypothetical protein